MNKLIEKKFVDKFIIKANRERTFFELCSAKKRDQIIHRLINIVDDRFEIFSDTKICGSDLIKQIEKVYDINSECYVIADSADDGKILPFKKAFEHMNEDCADYIIICGENVVVMKEEAIMGERSFKKILFRKL